MGETTAQAYVTFLPDPGRAFCQRGNTLLKWLEEFQPKKSHIPRGILTEDLGGDGRGLAGNDSRGGRRRSWNRQVDDLIGPENVCRRYAGAGGTNIEGFGELDEFDSGGVRGAQKDRHLQTDARGPSEVRGIHALTVLQKTTVCHCWFSTRDLVRERAYRMPHLECEQFINKLCFQRIITKSGAPIFGMPSLVHAVAIRVP
jgi:hypothetical protein